jgi:hypothetical protein
LLDEKAWKLMKIKNVLMLTMLILSIVIPGCGWFGEVGDCDGDTLCGSGGWGSEIREIQAFTHISIAVSGNVILRRGEGGSVKVETDKDLMKYIETVVEDVTLHIRFTEDVTNFQPSRSNRITLKYEDLQGLAISGSADVTCDDIATKAFELVHNGSGDLTMDGVHSERMTLVHLGSGKVEVEEVEADQVSLRSTGSGEIEIASVEVDRLKIELFGSGDMTLCGEVREQVIASTGSADYVAEELCSERANIRLSGSGNVTIWVAHDLDVRIPGSGEVANYGYPRLKIFSSDLGKFKILGFHR